MAAPRAWDEGIGTGVGSMDMEHRLQVTLVNAIEELVRQRRESQMEEGGVKNGSYVP